MLLQTPFHPRTAPLCHHRRWRNWSGYAAALAYEPSLEYEYYAVRSGTALFDVSPLRKYEVTGPDAAGLVDRVVTRNVFCCAAGRVLYTPWCDEAGKLIDDGTLQRLGADTFRITAADPCLRWFQDCAMGMDATVRDISLDLAALALQGPTSRDILAQLVTGADITALPFFGLTEGFVGAAPVTITRTGYTGDLGYEIWMRPDHALAVWDALVETGAGLWTGTGRTRRPGRSAHRSGIAPQGCGLRFGLDGAHRVSEVVSLRGGARVGRPTPSRP